MSRKEKMKIYHGLPTPSYVNKGESVHIDFTNEFYGKGVRQVIDRRNSVGGNKTALTLVDGATGRSAKFTKSMTTYSFEHSVLFNETFDLKSGVSISAIIKTKDIDTYFNGLYLINITDPTKSLTSPNTATVHRFLGVDKVTGSPKDRLSICAYKNDVIVPNKVITVDIPTDTYMHFQLISKNMVAYYYINGELIIEQDMSDFGMNITQFNCINFLFPTSGNGSLSIENLVVSKNTDVYPNSIPTDYLEGKAIVKERLNQQQIKGDPLISQETTTRVPPTGNGWMNTNGSSYGMVVSKENPYIFSSNTDLYTTGHFSIVGLNNEVISGVIDANTALCRVLKHNDRQTFYVDDVSKLSIGDIVQSVKPDLTSDDSAPRTITNIDTVNKTITLDSAYGGTADRTGFYFFETTVASSSPIVKSEDGTVVNGTWTGLGTSIAKFTVTPNQSHLQGKSVYVTYSLNIPSANSHFPELPSNIERAYTETGIEMKPVSEILITDDFKGKVNGDLTGCPHVSKFHNSPTITKPTQSWAGELKSEEYALIGSLDGSTVAVSNQLNDHYPQQMFEFDLISLVESKIGEIPSSDKLGWLKSNYQNVYVTYTGYCTSSSANNTMVTLFNHVQDKWMDAWLVMTGVSKPTTTTGGFAGDTNFLNLIPQGKLYVLVYTYKSDGVTPSVINTDYIKVDVRLKTDSTFTTLYCDSKRAREDRCNPVLIQKETKTVKRYIPSKECFVTESDYVKVGSAGNISGDASRKRLIADDFIYVTSLGTGDYGNTSEYYRNCISYIGDAFIKSITPTLIGQTLSTNLVSNNIKFTRVLSDSNNNDNRYLLPKEQFTGNYVCIKPFLMSKGNELNITLSIRYVKNGVSAYHTELEYTLPNRPLIK